MGSTVTIGSFLSCLREPFTAGRLFDQLPDIVYYIKDRAGRYLEVNRTLVQRCACGRKSDVVGDLSPVLEVDPELERTKAHKNRRTCGH